MKNLFLSVIILLFFCSLVTAQFNSGSKMVGASTSLDLGFNSQKYTTSASSTKYTTIDINPRAAYFIMNGVAVGGDVNYYFSRSKTGANGPFTTTTFLIGPFGRYYYKSVGPVRTFGEARFGGGTSAIRNNIATNGNIDRTNILYAGAGVGAAFFLADNFSLEALLGYTYEHRKNQAVSNEKINSHGIMLSFGFAFYFNSLLQE
jgi:hypothetical protein